MLKNNEEIEWGWGNEEKPEAWAGLDMAYESNPLISPPNGPWGPPAFDKIRPEHFMPALEYLANQNAAIRLAIKTNPLPPTYEDTILPLERIYYQAKSMASLFITMRDISGDSNYYDIYDSFIRKWSEFFLDFFDDKTVLVKIENILMAFPSRTEAENTLGHEKTETLYYCLKLFEACSNLSPAEREKLRIRQGNSDLQTALGANFLKNLQEKNQDKNKEIIPRILALRQEQARAAGYKNYAEMVLSYSMPGSIDAASRFLSDLLEGHKCFPVPHNDSPIVDHTYFKLDEAQDRLRQLVQKYFGLDLVQVDQSCLPSNPEIKTLEVRDLETGEVKGIIYADLMEREKKISKKASAMNLRQGTTIGHEKVLPLILIQCGFSSYGEISLDNLRTLFHETGHALQFLLSKQKPSPIIPDSVFVPEYMEIFSTIMEKMAFWPETIAGIARHRFTGEYLDPSDIEDVLASRKADDHILLERKIRDANLDLILHGDEQDLLDDLSDDEQKFLLRWHHIFANSYGARYYSYLWAAAAAATAHQELNLMGDAPNVTKLRRLFSESAGAPRQIFHDIIGRPPEVAALFLENDVTNKKSTLLSPPPAAAPQP